VDVRERILGDGSFSVCRRCVRRSDRKEFAVKIVSRRVDCAQEVAMLARCQGHPNVVNLVEVIQVALQLRSRTDQWPISV
jgi:ribosomal protein S6 kinase alpha-5